MAEGSGNESPHTSESSTPERVVQAQVDAYNRHDVDAFLATYAPDATIYAHPATERTSGRDAMRKEYTAFFDAFPDVTAHVTNRIVQGEYVIDHESLTGVPERLQGAAVAIYQVKQGRIVNVWFLE